jgi:hypothetical protein
MVQILPTGKPAPKPRESHQRQLVDGSDPAYKKTCSETNKSHQRQLVDGSDPT